MKYYQKYYETNLESVIDQKLDEKSIYLRSLIIKAIIGGGRGHIGPALSMVEIIRVLYDNFMKFKYNKIKWELRDRYILSKGHGCLALYSVLAYKKFFEVEELFNFCKYNSILGGHPEVTIPGVEASTGALGHGLPIGVGMAISLKNKKINSKVFVHMGDGEINEGSIWEAALSASKHQLNNLIVIIDYNKMQSAGPVKNILNMEPLKSKWSSFGFNVYECNGHDVLNIKEIFQKIYDDKGNAPKILIAHTIKGKGIKIAENNAMAGGNMFMPKVFGYMNKTFIPIKSYYIKFLRIKLYI